MSRGQEAQADALARYLEVLDTPVGLEERTKLVVIDAEDQKVGVLRVEPEQLVADGAADEVRVEPQRADVVLDLPLHSAQTEAIASISTSAPEGSAEISTVERAGRSSPT